jgi:hypothetical protein
MDHIRQKFKEFIFSSSENRGGNNTKTPFDFATSFLAFLNTNKVPCFDCGVFHGYKGGYRMGYYMCQNPTHNHRIEKILMISFIRNTNDFLKLHLYTERKKVKT